MNMRGRRQGQVTIFVIVGIMLVVVVLLFFYFRSGTIDDPDVGRQVEQDVQSFMRNCVEDDLLSLAQTIGLHGGYVDPESTVHLSYNGQPLAYLCYNINNYQSCVAQESQLLSHIRQELHTAIEPTIDRCLLTYQQFLTEQGYAYTFSPQRTHSIEMHPDYLTLVIDQDFSLSRTGEDISYDGLSLRYQSSLYSLATVAQEIMSQEAEYCHFDQNGYVLLYPEYSIDKFQQGEGSTIYIIEDLSTRDVFQFGVRGCVIPPGLG